MDLIELVETFEVSGYHNHDISDMINTWKEGLLDVFEEDILYEQLQYLLDRVTGM